MTPAAPAAAGNLFTQALPRAESRLLLAGCSPVEITLGEVVCEPGKTQRHVYFPQTACISLSAAVQGHPPLDMALVGRESMLGLSLALGIGAEAPLLGIVKCTGSALRMATPGFRRLLAESPALLRLMQREMFVLLAQVARTAACTNFHEVQGRLARWLLIHHDHANCDHFHLTHEQLANMLGVQRSAVTIAAGTLQKAQVISYSRGEIRILDRRGLEAMSCECYQASIRRRGG